MFNFEKFNKNNEIAQQITLFANYIKKGEIIDKETLKMKLKECNLNIQQIKNNKEIFNAIRNKVKQIYEPLKENLDTRLIIFFIKLDPETIFFFKKYLGFPKKEVDDILHNNYSIRFFNLLNLLNDCHQDEIIFYIKQIVDLINNANDNFINEYIENKNNSFKINSNVLLKIIKEFSEKSIFKNEKINKSMRYFLNITSDDVNEILRELNNGNFQVGLWYIKKLLPNNLSSSTETKKIYDQKIFNFFNFLEENNREEIIWHLNSLDIKKETIDISKIIISYFNKNKDLIESQYLPVLETTAFVLFEKIFEMKKKNEKFSDTLKNALSEDVSSQVKQYILNISRKNKLKDIKSPEIFLSLFVNYLLPKIKNSEKNSKKYFKQSSGVEIEVRNMIIGKVKFRKDWAMLNMFNVEKDPFECNSILYEIKTQPTESTKSQGRLISALIMGGFIEKDILRMSNEADYPIDISTVFLKKIYEKIQNEYVDFAGTLGIAYASQERLREERFLNYEQSRIVQDKTERGKGRLIKKNKKLLEKLPENLSLIEMRLLNLNTSIFSVLFHKEIFDFAFNCLGEKINGENNLKINIIEQMMRKNIANICQKFVEEIREFKYKYKINYEKDGFKEISLRQKYIEMKSEARKIIKKYSLLIRQEVNKFDKV